MESREFLLHVLASDALVPEDIDALVGKRHEEDQYHDYKSGKLLEASDAGETVRRWTAGFANAEGGVLLVGISDKPQDFPRTNRAVDGCSPIKKQSHEEWASNVLTEIAPFLSPPAKIHCVEHTKGKVLVVAVDRAPMLIPLVGPNKTWVYPIRIGHQTIDAPGYLVSDLVLGRRQHPVLDTDVLEFKANFIGEPVAKFARIQHVMIEIENLSVRIAEMVEVGLVAWSFRSAPSERPVRSPRFRHLLSHLDVEAPNAHHEMRICRAVLPRIGPFDAQQIRLEGSFDIPMHPGFVDAGLYIVAGGSPPLWFQLSFQYRADHNQAFSARSVAQMTTRPVPRGSRARLSVRPIATKR